MKFKLTTRTAATVVPVLACLIVLNPRPASAGVLTQIPDPFTTETFSSNVFAFSQFDTSTTLDATQRRDFATVYDNFSFGSDMFITQLGWVGGYGSIPNDPENTGGPVSDSFTVTVFDDDNGEPGTVLASYNAGQASETTIAGFDGFYSYAISVSPLAVTGGETYWFSAVAKLDSELNNWGLAFSDIGDDNSYQDFGLLNTSPVQRFNDPVDYAFSVTATAVPEPSSLALFGIGACIAGLRATRRCRGERQRMTAA